MIRLRALGAIDLVDDSGAELTPVLRQPKRFALLAYLALERPHGFQTRDTLLALLWPALDADRARAALRQALYLLRRTLPEAVLVSRGREQIGIRPSSLWCDARAFEDAVIAGRPEDGLELYRGDLLDGLYVAGASSQFGQWLEGKRERLRGLAARAAWDAAAVAEARGARDAARHWARRAVDLAPLDERGVRRRIALLDRLGDRAGALAESRRWAERLREELDVEPAPETLALVEAIRHRRKQDPRRAVAYAGSAGKSTV